MTSTRRRRGEDGISFEHRGPCSDPHRHRHCPGLWRGEFTTGYTGDGKGASGAEGQRQDQGRRGGQAPPTCTPSSTKASPPKPGDAHYTVRQAAEDWLAHGLEGRSPKTVTKNQNVLEPILAVIGARKLRDLTAADVRQALAAMAAGYSTAAVSMGHLALKRAIRHAEANDLVSPQRRSPGRHAQRPGRTAVQIPDPGPGPGGHDRRGDPAGDGTAARPQRRPPPGRADARLHRAEPAVPGSAPRRPAPCAGTHVDLDGDPAARPPRAPARRRVAVGPRPRRDQDRTVPPHPRASPQRQSRRCAPGRTARPRSGSRPGIDWQDTGLVFTSHQGAALDAGNVRKMFKRICTEAGIGDELDPARAADHLRQP